MPRATVGLSDERLKRESLRFRWLEDRGNRSPLNEARSRSPVSYLSNAGDAASLNS
jgi:hypothetical protein